jgi:predicted lipoprotein with Yx(FWY)xxD motif
MNRSRLIFTGLAGAAALVVALAIALSGGSDASGSAVSPGPAVRAANSSLGRILVDARGRTLYLFEKDQAGRSSCSGLCATYWPPAIARGKTTAGTGLRRSLLSTTRRDDGSRQFTYAGHPLYRFSGDQAPGQATGQGMNVFGAEWYVLSAAGHKVEEGGK